MAQHFLLSSKNNNLPISNITKLSDFELFNLLKVARWGNPNNINLVICPQCNKFHQAYFIKTRKQWKCKYCKHNFSITSKTIFHSSKLSLKQIVLAIYLFSSKSKGLSAIELSCILGVQYKTAWLLLQKFRETLNNTKDLSPLCGEVHIDGCYINHYIRPKNFKQNRIDRRIKRNQRKDKSCIAVFRQRNRNQDIMKGADRSVVALIHEENTKDISELVDYIVKEDSTICTDEHHCYDSLSTKYNLKRVNHSQEYCSIDGVTNNLAESFFARFRRMQIGIHHKISNKYVIIYANEICWREDNRRKTVLYRFQDILNRCMRSNISKYFTGYHQGKKRNYFVWFSKFSN